ncbi:hypothetical protein Tco_1014809, partial [Tanacetum coccineum]
SLPLIQGTIKLLDDYSSASEREKELLRIAKEALKELLELELQRKGTTDYYYMRSKVKFRIDTVASPRNTSDHACIRLDDTGSINMSHVNSCCRVHLLNSHKIINMQKKLGNGADTYFWKDLWHGDMENLTWSFRRAPRSGVEQDQLTDLTTYVEGVVLGVTLDR